MGSSGNSQMGLSNPWSKRFDEYRKLVTNPTTVGEVAVYVQSLGLKVVTGRLASVLLTPRPPVTGFFGERWLFQCETTMFIAPITVTLLPLVISCKDLAGLILWRLLEWRLRVKKRKES